MSVDTVFEELFNTIINVLLSVGISVFFAHYLDQRRAEKEHFNKIKRLVIEPLLSIIEIENFPLICGEKMQLARSIVTRNYSSDEFHVLFKDLIENHYDQLIDLVDRYCELKGEYDAKTIELRGIIGKIIEDNLSNVKTLDRLYPGTSIDVEQLIDLYLYFLSGNEFINTEQLMRKLKRYEHTTSDDEKYIIKYYTYTIARNISKNDIEVYTDALKTLITRFYDALIRGNKNVELILKEREKILAEVRTLLNSFKEELQFIYNKTRLPHVKKYIIFGKKCPYI